jgi:hypothetical protein
VSSASGGITPRADLHLELAAAADGTDDELVGLVMRFGAIGARWWPPLFVVARDDPNLPDLTLDDLYFLPPVDGVREVVENLAARLVTELDVQWAPPFELRRVLADFSENASRDEPDHGEVRMLGVLESARMALVMRAFLGGGPVTDWVADHQDVNLPIVETISEMRFAAMLARDTIVAIRWAQDGEPPVWKALLWDHADLPADREHALVFACDVVNHALLDFAPRLVPVPQGLDENPRLAAQAQARLSTVTGAAFVNIAWDLAEGGSYRVCARPRCGKFFRVKRGGAKFGQYRRYGTKYHTRECQRLAGRERERARNSRAKAQAAKKAPE